MSLQDLPPTDALVVPSRRAPFLEMWGPLASVPSLFVPVGIGDEGGPHRVTEGRVLELLDAFTWRVEEGLAAALVYTDARLLRERTVFVGAPTALVLERLFDAGRVRGVAFNYPLCDAWTERGGETIQLPDVAYETPFHVTVRREALPRLAGLCASSDPLAKGSASHAELAAAALARDLPCVALHHAIAAREGGAPPPDACFVELDVLFTLGLDHEAAELLQWAADHLGGGQHDLRMARALALSGQTGEAETLAATWRDDVTHGRAALLEIARARLVAGDARGALAAFDEVAATGELPAEARLGRGLALRGLAVPANDADGLRAALAAFHAAAEPAGHHAAESLHHAAALHAMLGQTAEAESAARGSLGRRDDPGTRVLLIAALLAQGRRDEATTERTALGERHPHHAAQVAPLFGEKGSGAFPAAEGEKGSGAFSAAEKAPDPFSPSAAEKAPDPFSLR